MRRVPLSDDDPFAEFNPIRANPNVVPIREDIGPRDPLPDNAYVNEFGGPTVPEPPITWPTPYDMFDEAGLAPRRWIYGRHYLRSFVSVLASAGGIGKTSLQIVEALSIITGRPLLGEEVHERCPAWIVNLEDPLEELQRRVLAVMRYYGIKPDEVRGKLFLDAGRDFRMKFATQTRDGVIPNAALIGHMIEKIRGWDIGVTFIDPFVGAHDVNENDNGAVNQVVAQIRDVADATSSAIGLVHHVRKGNGDDATIDSVRGAGSLIGAARAARVINRLSESEAARLNVDELEARSIFRVDDGKANLAPPATAAVWRRMHGVKLDNGDWVGVCVSYSPPDAFEGISAADTMRVQRIIAKHEVGSLRADVRAKNWVGHVVGAELEIDTSDKEGRGRVGQIVNAWIKSKVLRIEHIFSARDGREMAVITTGEWVHHDEI